ncbi:MAG: glycosyltransferase family 2 protein [Myxococcota bacterium]
MSLPSVSVVVRSHRRTQVLLELLARVLDQNYPNYEVVVIEQTPDLTAEQRTGLDALVAEQAGKLRIAYFPPLGAVRARNEAWKAARNEVVLFIDDDDVPLGRDWVLNHAKNFEDPNCIGVSGRHVFSLDEDATQFDTDEYRRTVLRYTFFKMPRARNRLSERVQGVEILHGTNTSIRREAIERAGGWDEDVTEFVDENSFDFRYERIRKPGEYFVYDPLPTIWRRFDIQGGTGRRWASIDRLLRLEFDYSHGLLRRYHPLRFYGLYPAYVALGVYRAVDFVHTHHPEIPATRLASDVARSLIPTILRAWRKPRARDTSPRP